MLILLSLVVLALAAVAGYAFGVRRQARPDANPAAVAEVPADHPGPPEAGENGTSAEKARIIRSRDAEAARLRQHIANLEAPLSQLAQFGVEREHLFGELGDARAETARYRQLVVDIENNAPPPILSGSSGPDDLKMIVGIGPVLERMLHNLGIMTYRQIARWSERDIAEFDSRLPEFPGRIVRDQWVTQSRALHQSKYGESLPELRSLR